MSEKERMYGLMVPNIEPVYMPAGEKVRLALEQYNAIREVVGRKWLEVCLDDEVVGIVIPEDCELSDLYQELIEVYSRRGYLPSSTTSPSSTVSELDLESLPESDESVLSADSA